MNEMMNSPAPSGIQMNAPSAANSVAMVFQSREMVETLGMMQMAKMNPRDPEVVRQRLLLAAKNENLAVAAEYIYAKGGTEVTGLSIRAAEAMARAYGNIDAGCREVEVNEKETICQAYCWDMETNSRFAEVFHVPHSRTKGKWDENGRRVGTEVVQITDQRELDEITRSRGSRIKRACILAAIPVDIQEDFADACEKTLTRKLQRMVDAKAKTADDDSGEKQYTIKDMIEDMLTTLSTKYGVSRRMVCDRFQKKRDEDLFNLDNRQVVMLLRILTGLKDGIATPADYFKGATSERAVVMIGATGASGSTGNASVVKNAVMSALAGTRGNGPTGATNPPADKAPVQPPKKAVSAAKPASAANQTGLPAVDKLI